MEQRSCDVILYTGNDPLAKELLRSGEIPLNVRVEFISDAEACIKRIYLSGAGFLFLDEFVSGLPAHVIIRTLNDLGCYFPFAVLSHGTEEHCDPSVFSTKPMAFIRGNDLRQWFDLLLYNLFSQSELKQQLEFLIAAWNRDDESFSFLSENVPFVVWIRDISTGKILYCNSMTEKILRTTREFILSLSPEFLNSLPCGSIIFSHIQEDKERLDKGMDNFFIRYFETEVFLRDGNRIRMGNVTRVVKKSDGTWFMLGVSRNISREKNQRETFLLQEERFRGVVDSAPISIFLTRDEKFVHANKAALSMFQCDSLADIVGRSIYDFSRPDYTETVRRRCRDLKEKEGTLPLCEQVWLGAHGREFPVEVWSSLVYFSGLKTFLVFAKDISEQKEVEKKLEEKSSLIESLYRCAPVAMGVSSRKILIEANARLFDLTGYSSGELVGKSLRVLHESDEAYVTLIEKISPSLSKGDRAETEIVIRKKDGALLNVLLSCILSHAFDEELCFFTMIDISGRRAAERLADERNTLVNGLYRLAPNAMGVIRNGILVDANPRLFEMTGYSPDELVGGTFRKLHESEEEFLRVAREARHMVREGPMLEMETVYRKKDGTLIDVLVRRTLASSLGAGTYIFNVMDISLRKKAEREIQIRERELFDLYEKSPVSMILLDDNLYALRANRAAREFSGRDTFEKMHLGTFIRCAKSFGNTGDEPCPGCELISLIREMNSLDSGTVRSEIELEIVIDGKPVRKTLKIFCSKTEIVNEKMILFCFTDISHQKSLETRLYQVQKLEALGKLAGGIAHDFNNILSAMHLQLSELRYLNSSDDELSKDLSDLSDCVARGMEMTRNLLLLGKQSTAENQLFDLNDMISGTVKMLRRLIGKKIGIRHERSAHELMLFADRSMIERVLMNLCLNARDAMPDGGTLLIGLDKITQDQAAGHHPDALSAGGYAKLTVKDTGKGFSPEIKNSIFEPFFSTKSAGEGTGLGLSIVSGIVDRYGGWIDVESEPGAGTEFSVYLPLPRNDVIEE
jgi:PAS domain S-box-containing protein